MQESGFRASASVAL